MFNPMSSKFGIKVTGRYSRIPIAINGLIRHGWCRLLTVDTDIRIRLLCIRESCRSGTTKYILCFRVDVTE